MNDKEHEQVVALELETAITAFEDKLQEVGPYGDVRLYAEDRKGYANCVLSASRGHDGTVNMGANRMNEL
jgi:hypothetical protein